MNTRSIGVLLLALTAIATIAAWRWTMSSNAGHRTPAPHPAMVLLTVYGVPPMLAALDVDCTHLAICHRNHRRH